MRNLLASLVLLAACSPGWTGRYRFADGSWTQLPPPRPDDVVLEVAPAGDDRYVVRFHAGDRTLESRPNRVQDDGYDLQVALRVDPALPLELPRPGGGEGGVPRIEARQPVSGDLHLVLTHPDDPHGHGSGRRGVLLLDVTYEPHRILPGLLLLREE